MKFYNRENEMEMLRRFNRVAIIGRRRVGKTRLVEETFGDKCLTLFIPAEKSERLICMDWINELRSKGIYVPEIVKMKDILEYLMRTQKDYVIFLDELQNVLKVNKAFLYDLQRLLDKYRDSRLIISGSLISMSKKIAENYKSPLYGRFETIIKLKELDFITVAKICKDLGYNIEDAIKLYSTFGGIPKYYETLEKLKIDAMKFIEYMFFEDPYPLVEDIRLMLREEFGKEYKIYFSILEAISESKNTFGEIGGYIGLEANKLSKYIYNLEREYEIISKTSSILVKSKRIYTITSNLINFWFKFVWKNYSNIYKNDLAKRNFEQNFNQYLGLKFEDICKEIIDKFNLGFKISNKGKIWFKTRDKKVHEIDLVIVDENYERMIFFETKWSKLNESECEKILEELEEKVKLLKIKAKETYFGIIAKKIENKNIKNAFLFDLEDINKII